MHYYLSWIFTTVLFIAFPGQFHAQNRFSLEQIEGKLKTLSDPDSIVYFLQLGAQISREKDQIHNWVSYTLEYLGQREQYRQEFNDGKLLNIWRDPANSDEASISVRFYSHMGYYYSQDGNIHLSTQYYTHALVTCDRFQVDIDQFEEILKPLGNNYLRLGDFERASDLGYRMKDWVQRTRDLQAEGAYYNFMGLFHKLKGEQEEALEAYQRGLAIKDASPAILGKLASNLSLLLSERGDNERAEQYALDALRHLSTLKTASDEVNEDLALHLIIIAQIKLNQPDLSAAYDYINNAISLAPFTDRRTYAKMLVIRGSILRLAGYPDAAIDDFNVSIGQFIDEFNPKVKTDNPSAISLPAENTVFEALEGKADAFSDLFISTNEPRYLVNGLDCHKLALEAELLLRRQLSTEFSRNVISADSKRRNSKALAILAQLQSHNVHPDCATDALAMMESAKANSVLESIYLRIQDADASRDANPALQQLTENIRVKERELQGFRSEEGSGHVQIAEIERTLNQLKLQLAEERAVHLSHFGDYAHVLDTQFNHRSLHPANVLRDTAQALIEYFIHGDAGYAIVVRKNRNITFTELRDMGKIVQVTQDLVNILHSRAVMNSEMREFGQYAHWLYQRLISDVIGDLSGLSSLVIVPDGILNYLPFEVLISRLDSAMSYSGMPFLIRELPVCYAHSSGVLALQNQLHSKVSRGIAFAPFTQEQRGFGQLTFSNEEIDASAAFHIRRYVGNKGSFHNFLSLAPGSRIIHLATHASVDSTGLGMIEFIDSSMLLSDVYYLPLQCNLAILSACESAFGQNSPSEGILSFARAFALAGTKSILASHWRLNDNSGAAIITSLYKHLRRENPIAASLRQAKLDYLDDPDIPEYKKSPHYWASIVMFGSDGEIEAMTGYSWIVTCGIVLLIILYVFLFRRKLK